MRLRSLLVLTVLLAGCSDSPTGRSTDPSVGPENQIGAPEAPAPEPVFVAVEPFNETLGYAHFVTGSNEASDFLLAEDARAVRMTVWARGECPLTTYDEPQVTVTSPDGTATSVALMPPSNASACPFVEPDFVLVDEVDLLAVPGEWVVETVGDCSCEARVAVTAEVPE